MVLFVATAHHRDPPRGPVSMGEESTVFTLKCKSPREDRRASYCAALQQEGIPYAGRYGINVT